MKIRYRLRRLNGDSMNRKHMLIKEFFREIKKSRNRFLSILVIVTLGVAFFSGVRAACPDMKLSADIYFDEANLMDLRVLSTLGLTDEDVKALEEIEGVEKVEPSYSGDVLCRMESSQPVLHLMCLTKDINRVTVTEGRLPEKADEIFMDQKFMDNNQLSVGDRITVFSGDEDQKIEDIVTNTEFTIVGSGNSPFYMSLDRGTSTIGNGSVSGFGALVPDSFSVSAYTEIYMTVSGAKEEICYDDTYEEMIDTVKERIDKISDHQCEIRYASIKADGQEDIDEAKAEIADARKKLSDAQKELNDGKKQLRDGKEEIAEKEDELESGKTQLQQEKEKLEDGKKQLTAAWNEISIQKEKLNTKSEELYLVKSQLQEKENELAEGEVKLSEGIRQVQEGETQLNQAKKELSAAEAILSEKKEEVESGRNALPVLKQQLEQLNQMYPGLDEMETQLPALKNTLLELEQQLEQLLQNGEDSEGDTEIYEGEGSDENSGQEATIEQLREEIRILNEQIISIETMLEQRNQLENAIVAAENGIQEYDNGMLQLQQGSAEIAAKEQELNAAKEEIEKSKAEIVSGKTQLEKAKAQITSSEAQLNAGRQQLLQAEQLLNSKQNQIAEGERKLTEAIETIREGESALEEAKRTLNEKEAELKDAEKEFEEESKKAEKEIHEGEEKIADAEEELEKLEVPTWYVLGRNSLQTFVEYGQDSERIGAIGNVFPVIFFLVAALICLTTMTRMVEENRTQIGMLKALGYGKGAIAGKYLAYALLASSIGSLIGVFAGQKTLPVVIIQAYKILYNNLPVVQAPVYLGYSLSSSLVAVGITGLAAGLACFHELREVPANLMRPEAPKKGKRIFLERISFLWNHFSFSQKATARNLLRYKKRFFMTVFGIGGCMGLLMVGFGLKDSIMAIAQKQFGEVRIYSSTLTLDGEITEEERENLLDVISKDTDIKEYTEAMESSVDVGFDDQEKSSYLVVVPDKEQFKKFVCLKNRTTQEEYELDDTGVVITEKLSKLLGVQEGDTIYLKDGDTKRVAVRVTHIAENYYFHYVYMTSEVYKEIYGEEPKYLEIFTVNQSKDEVFEEKFSKRYIGEDGVLSVTMLSTMEDKIANLIKSMDAIIYVIVIAAGMLAFVVLYNLNNINISERRRELATLKVLGFYEPEVSMYVFRENIILTVIGIIAGVGFGIVLHRFVILTAEIDLMMFGRDIRFMSYFYSICLTILFSLLVNLFMHFKLKKLDMVESMKSVE